MIQRPDMIMIGAADRKAGKTTLACALIELQAARHRVVAVKVTTIDERGGECPRGGDGCGACGSLKENFCITEETNSSGSKDTARMLRAGADKVYWLRVLREHLAEGISSLLGRIPEPGCVVCESNSARLVLQPGVFLVVQNAGAGEAKPSCRAVMQYADRIIISDGKDKDSTPDNCVFTGRLWLLKPEAAAIILAGGESSRMGQNKSLMPVNGKPMIAHIADQLKQVFPCVFIGANDAPRYSFLGFDVVPDLEQGHGPLMGIISCLRHSAYELNFITACDIPDVNIDFVLSMIKAADGCDIVVPVSEGDKYEPLFAVYRKTVAGPGGDLVRRGRCRIAELFPLVKTRTVPMPDTDWYRNVNTMEEYGELTRPESAKGTVQ